MRNVIKKQNNESRIHPACFSTELFMFLIKETRFIEWVYPIYDNRSIQLPEIRPKHTYNTSLKKYYMTTITSKLHPIKFYFPVIFGAIFFFSSGTLLLFASIDILQKADPTLKEYLFPVLSLSFYLLSFQSVYDYWKNAPKIILDKDSIKIGKETFYLKDIKDIVLTGKMPFKFIITTPMEGTSILFNNGTEKILFDDMYSNSSEIKLFLQQVVLKKQDFNPGSLKETNENTIQFEDEITFKGNQFPSYRGILLWGVIGTFLFILIAQWQNMSFGAVMALIVLGIFWFILFSWQMHYFGLTKDHLIVRNHNFTWKVETYRLKDIMVVVFESNVKQPNCMRIITKDFINKVYLAATLRNKTWLELKRQLEANGVKVRNECIYEAYEDEA